jgi:hypothetical protein
LQKSRKFKEESVMASNNKKSTGINVAAAKKVTANKVGISAPWVTYFKEVYNLFANDANVTVDPQLTDDGNGKYHFNITSDNQKKLAALRKVLKTEIVMGNITLKINLNYTGDTEPATLEDWVNAFEGNPYFATTATSEAPGLDFGYAIFERDIITFFNDDLTDYCGNAHKVVADVVRDVTKESSIIPCTKAK